MIDLIGFSLPLTGIPELENKEVSWKGTFRGNYKNFRITQATENIYCSGSLAKFLQGENVTTLSRKGVEESLMQLMDETGWDLSKAKLTKIEIGCTLPVDRPVCEYLKSLGRLPRNKLITYYGQTLETVLNKTGNKSFYAYDKRIQVKNNIPTIFQGCELLRLELRYKKGLKQSLGEHSPLNLVDKDFYKTLVNNFKETYFSIPKKRIPVLDISEGLCPKDIDNLLEFLGIYSNPNVIRTIESCASLSRPDRVRAKIRNLSTDIKFTEPNELIKELDSKVLAQTQFI